VAVATQTRTEDRVIRRLTVDEVIQMAELGIIGETEHVELIDGQLVTMSPEGTSHAGITSDLLTFLAVRYGPRYQLRSNSTLPTSEYSFMQPDLFVVVGETDLTRFPGPAEIPLLVEVADTSVAFDRGRKAQAYARFGAETYWVVDLGAQEIVVHTDPETRGYATMRIFRPGEALPIPLLDGAVPVESILGGTARTTLP
jgi:Uma2 family endonuclease